MKSYNVCFTKDLNCACYLVALGYKIHEVFGIQRDNNGTASFYFEPEHPEGGKESAHDIIKQFNVNNSDNYITRLVMDIFENREAMLDYLKKSKPLLTVQHGRYSVVMPGNIDPKKAEELINKLGGKE